MRTASHGLLLRGTFREESPEAYERLLLDALIGDPTLFIRTDEVEQCWRIVDPIIEHWEDDPADPDVRGRLVGADRRRPADRPRRPRLAQQPDFCVNGMARHKREGQGNGKGLDPRDRVGSG